jgi:hypothetical protein
MPTPRKSLALCSTPRSWSRASDGRLHLPFVTREGVRGAVYAAPDNGLARAIKSVWPAQSSFILASEKSSVPVYCESALERDAYLHFEFDPQVASYRVQPYSVEYQQKPILRTFPDAEVREVDGSWTIIQIKMRSTYEKHLAKPHFRNEAALFRSLGWNYRVLTEVEIRVEPRLENLKLMHHYRDLLMPDAKPDEVIKYIGQHHGARIGEVTAALAHIRVHLTDIVSLVAQNKLQADLDRPLDDDTMIQLS